MSWASGVTIQPSGGRAAVEASGVGRASEGDYLILRKLGNGHVAMYGNSALVADAVAIIMQAAVTERKGQ